MPKKFSVERYEEIKKLLSDNKVSSDELEKYIVLKALRHQRHILLNGLTDDEMVAMVNAEIGDLEKPER